MKRLPFRRRLTIWSTIVAAVSIVVCGAGAAWFVYQRELVELDANLRAQTDHFFAEIMRHGGPQFDWRRIDSELREWLPMHTPPRLVEIRTGEEVRWRSENLAAPGLAEFRTGVQQVQIGGVSQRLLVTEQAGITFAIAGNLDDAKGSARGLAFGLLAALPFALAFAWIGGRRLAALAVAPVEEMTTAAERVTAEHLDRRVPVPPVADEIQHHARVLNATLDRLELSYQQALRFSGDASHELKTPLTILRTSIEALLDSPTLGDHDRTAIDGLLEQTQRLAGITSSLLLLARADAGRLNLDLAAHDLASLTEACAEDARIVAEPRHIRVACTLPSVASARVDPLRFAQIVSNLLDNAVKYNHADGEVRVTLAENGAVWQLAIANTGPEIPPEYRARLFERFFRAEHTSEETGQGLGLSLARELARAHGGDVTLVRSENGWTEFALTLPKTATSENAAADFSNTRHPNMQRTTNIIAVLTAALISTAAADEAPVKGLDKIPAAAVEGLKKYAAEHSMKIEKVATEKHGKVTVYEAELTAPGKPNHEVAVTADGKVKGEEETIPLETVPDAARKAIEAGAKGMKIQRVQKIQEDGLVTYEAAYVNAKGKVTEVAYLEDGKIAPE